MFTKVSRVGVGLICALGMMVFASGCHHSKEKILDTDTGSQSRVTPPPAPGPITSGLPEVGSDLIFDKIRGMQKVFFDYNSYALRPDALATLQKNADMLKQVPTAMVQIEGHCDERGTQEYNLALGEKRALATREYLIKLGIPADHIVTISYGKEMPAVQGHNEAAWSQNRRCEFNKAM